MSLKWTRRQFLTAGALGAGGAGSVFSMMVEARRLETRVTDLVLPGPGSLGPLTILQLSDLHCTSSGTLSLIEEAIELGLRHNPDLICLTGDFVTDGQPAMWGRYPSTLRRLTNQAPVYAVLGNHDGGTWCGEIGGFPTPREVTELLTGAGIRVLSNSATSVSHGGGTLVLVGTADLQSGEFDPGTAFADVRADPHTPVIVMSHNPDTKDAIGSYPWHLMLSGHTHGGQVVLPIFGPPYVPVHDRRFIAGLYSWRDRQLYVSKGVGNLLGVRMNCRPEVTILRIRRQPGEGPAITS